MRTSKIIAASAVGTLVAMAVGALGAVVAEQLQRGPMLQAFGEARARATAWALRPPPITDEEARVMTNDEAVHALLGDVPRLRGER